jgi:hypothetical protein
MPDGVRKVGGKDEEKAEVALGLRIVRCEAAYFAGTGAGAVAASKRFTTVSVMSMASEA